MSKINMWFIVYFLFRKIFRGNLNEAISLIETASFRFPRKIFLVRKLTILCYEIAHEIGQAFWKHPTPAFKLFPLKKGLGWIFLSLIFKSTKIVLKACVWLGCKNVKYVYQRKCIFLKIWSRWKKCFNVLTIVRRPLLKLFYP